MASSWMTCIVLLGALTAVVRAQEFNFLTSESIETHEGQAQPLILEIRRTGDINLNTTVNLRAYEVTNNYKLDWEVPVWFFSGEETRVLPLGVIDDSVDEPDRMYIFVITAPSSGSIGTRNRVVVSYSDNDGPAMFNCNTGDLCLNGGACNSDSGLCDCNMFAFSDCSVNIANLDRSACSATTCGRGGVCVADGAGGARCVCQPGYIGATCSQQQRYNVQCFSDRMCLNVDPPLGYNGNRYIKDKGGLSECTLSDVTPSAISTFNLPAEWSGSYICLPNDHLTCGNAVVATESDGSSTTSRQVMIRQNMLRTMNDILFTGYCRFDSRGVLYFQQNNISTGSGLVLVNDTDFITPAFVYTIDQASGNQITVSTLTVGQEVCFAVILETGFEAIRLDSVIATDTLDPPSTYDVLSDGCPVPNTVNVVSRLPYRPDASNQRLIHFCINAFLFENSNRVGLRFQTTICANAVDCSQYTCSNGATSHGRKKRQSNGNEVMKILKTEIVVRDPQSEPPQTSSPLSLNSSPNDCKLSSPIIAALAVLAVLALLLLFAIVLLLVRGTRSRDKNPQ